MVEAQVLDFCVQVGQWCRDVVEASLMAGDVCGVVCGAVKVVGKANLAIGVQPWRPTNFPAPKFGVRNAEMPSNTVANFGERVWVGTRRHVGLVTAWGLP